MTSFIVFKVLGQLYGIDIDYVKRILPSQFLTAMPDEGEHIDGMFQYENEIIKVLSFRKAIGEDNYEEALQKKIFPELKADSDAWLSALNESIEKGAEFSRNIDPHACHLGKWIDSFHSDDKEISAAINELGQRHQTLHSAAAELLEIKETDPEKAKKMLNENIYKLYKETISSLKNLSSHSDKIAANLQRCLILLGKDGKSFGVNIDDVDDIIHVQKNRLHVTKETQNMGEFMNVSAILEHNGNLITIIKDVSIEKRSA